MWLQSQPAKATAGRFQPKLAIATEHFARDGDEIPCQKLAPCAIAGKHGTARKHPLRRAGFPLQPGPRYIDVAPGISRYCESPRAHCASRPENRWVKQRRGRSQPASGQVLPASEAGLRKFSTLRWGPRVGDSRKVIRAYQLELSVRNASRYPSFHGVTTGPRP